MKALRLHQWKSEPVLTDVPEPHPGPGQAVVRIGGAETPGERELRVRVG